MVAAGGPRYEIKPISYYEDFDKKEAGEAQLARYIKAYRGDAAETGSMINVEPLLFFEEQFVFDENRTIEFMMYEDSPGMIYYELDDKDRGKEPQREAIRVREPQREAIRVKEPQREAIRVREPQRAAIEVRHPLFELSEDKEKLFIGGAIGGVVSRSIVELLKYIGNEALNGIGPFIIYDEDTPNIFNFKHDENLYLA